MSTIAEPIIQEVAANLDEAAAVTRTLNATAIGSFTFGVGTGVVVGFLWGYRYNKKKLYSEAFEYAEEQIKEATSEMAEHYRSKELALVDRKKDPIDKIVKERGYAIAGDDEDSVRPTTTTVEERKRPLPSPVPILTEPTEIHTWDYTKETANRNPRLPYVIHKDEFDAFDAYENVTYAWYPLDEVLADEDNNPVANIAEIVGAENLERFGHGSGDPNVVFVRNNALRLQIEITREAGRSYAEDVEGLDASGEEISGVVDVESS